jgi:hypothetical protein
MNDYNEEERPDFISTIEETITAEVNRRCSEIQERCDYFSNEYYKMFFEIKRITEELEKANKREVSNDFVTNNIVSKINKDNIEHLFEFLLTKTHNEEDSMDCPVWLKLLVNYYNDKELVLKLLNIAKVDYPDYAKTIRLPYEWNEQELDLFFDTMHNHYVCNGAIYRANLGFWYREWQYGKFDIEKGLSHNYSQVPWQFLLKNPLLNSEKYAHKMASEINRGNHGTYFIEVFDYQKLDSEIKNIIFREIKKLPEMSRWNFYKLMERNLDSLSEEWMNKYFNTLVKEDGYNIIDKINKLPKEYIYKFLRQHKNVFEVLPKINLTEQEKVEFVKGL